MADSADLLFRIRADSAQARTEVSQFRGLVKKEVDDIAQTFAGGAGRVGQFAASLGPAGLALGATAGAAIGAGTAIFTLAKNAADAGSKFNDLSLKTGLSVETLSGLELQLKQSGASMETLGNAAVIMQKNLGEAASGNKELQKTFAALGIKDVRAALADTDGTLRTLLKSLGEMETAGERNAAGSKVMGRGFKELSVFLADTKGDLDAVINESERAGRVMSTSAAQAADAFGDQLDALTQAASTAARSFGIEFVPVITEGMADMTGALDVNANKWKEWGTAVADVLRGLREVYDSEFGQSFRRSVGWLMELNSLISPFAGTSLSNISSMGAQARGVTGNQQDLANEMARLRSKNTTAPADPSDFFSPPAKATREKNRKDELDKLKAFAKEWEFTITSLTGGRHNKGSLHGQGRAMDVSVRGKTDAEVARFMEAARASGFGVRDERTRPAGQKVWSGPHLHLETQSKAVQAAVQAESKAFDDQRQVLERLARAISDADLQLKGFTRSTVEQQIATEYEQLGIGQLTGATAELGEALFAQRAEQIKAIDAAEKHATALKNLIALAEEWMEVAPPPFTVPDFKLGAGPMVDPSGLGVAPPVPQPGFLDAFRDELKDTQSFTAGFGETVAGAFQDMTAAIGQSAAAALVFGQSFGKAMLAATKSALASIAAMAFVEAIKEAALGFAKLANFLPGPAALHFKSAALWAAAGVAAGGAGALLSGGGSAFGDSGGGNVPGGGGAAFAAPTQDRTISEGRRGGSSDPNEAAVMGYMMVDVKHDDGHVERQLTRVWRRMGQFRDEVMASTVGTAPSQ